MAKAMDGNVANPARVFEFLFSSTEIAGLPNQLRVLWGQIRGMVIVPVIRLAVVVCLVMSAMVFFEKLTMGIVSLYAKIFRRRPQRIYKCDPLCEDEEIGTLAYPMVLVQIPMYNEKEMKSAAGLPVVHWSCMQSVMAGRPDSIQVLDDSTDSMVKDLIRGECEKWLRRGKNIKYETRGNRNGYKAGALKEGLKHNYIQICDHVAIFDADFQPEPDFLMRAMPFLVHNPDIDLVQARWTFVNAKVCLLTRMQEMTMNYHFKVEQESGSSTFAFFGYNGTAGVWRIQAINDAGGWNDRTTVEDMDLAVRASLGGSKFVYVGSIKISSDGPWSWSIPHDMFML